MDSREGHGHRARLIDRRADARVRRGMVQDVRKVMLEVIAGSSSLQTRSVIHEVVRRIGARNEDEERAVLACWHDLMRTGLLAWGYNADNPEPPFAHVTEHGRRTLQNLSRDPSNPDGYLAALGKAVPRDSIAWSYVTEALAAYNADCYKSAAIMTGAAGESLLLGLRDRVQAKLTAASLAVPRDLVDWRIKRVLDAIESELEQRIRSMPGGLAERFRSFWSPFGAHIRLARNDAGHPKSIEPVTVDVVHGSLLIFPEFAKLICDISSWVDSPAYP